MPELAQTITIKSSFQTYITIQLLVDQSLKQDCFKAYAYFRWLDDQIDFYCPSKSSRLALIKRQQQIINSSYKHQPWKNALPEEQFLIDLIATNTSPHSKLGSFISNFFAIIAYDAKRKDNFISQSEFTWYTQTLAKAVTDGIEHFINHDYSYPDSTGHYQAAIGAHVAHMLRDYRGDLTEGYFNLPSEYLSKHRLLPTDTKKDAFQAWVEQQVGKACHHIEIGKPYIAALPVLRGKLAATWYCARFEQILAEIKADHYILRSHYHRRSKLSNYWHMLEVALQVIFTHYWPQLTRNNQ